MSLKDDALAAYTRQVLEEEAAEERTNETLALQVEPVFVRSFGWAPTRMIADERTFEVDDMLFYYHRHGIKIKFSMLGKCPRCEKIDPEEISNLADIGRILEQGLRYHECPAPTAAAEGPEARIAIALIDLIEAYS